MSEVTQLLQAISIGDRNAAEELLPLLYNELRRLAARRLAREKPGLTLQPTALVHEAYVQLVDQEMGRKWDSRGHFFAAAATAMRRVLVDHARRKQSLKRGGDWQQLPLDEDAFTTPEEDERVLALHEGLESFAKVDPRSAQLVTLRFFAGLTLEEAAQSLEISLATAKRDWAYARAWLNAALSDD